MTIGTCPACGRAHAAGAEVCPHCGEPLTAVARILAGPAGSRSPRWLEQNRKAARNLKKAEALSSEARFGALLDTDRRRLEAERSLAARTETRERRAVLLAGILIGLVAALASGALLAILF